MPHRTTQDQRGFSLIEVALVLTLLTIMTGVYLTTFDPRGAALDRAVRRLEADLRYAQQLTMNEETAYGFSLTWPSAYWIFRGVPTTIATDPHTKGPLTVDLTTAYPGVTFNAAAPAQFQFDPAGRPNAGIVTLRLQRAGRMRTITIQGTTGLIQVQ